MKPLVTLLALAGFAIAPAIAAQEWGGLSGRVTDLQTGQPITNAQILYYRATDIGNNPFRLMRLATDQHGFFRKMPLEPGRYVVMARVPGRTEGCAVDDVMGGQVTHLRILVGYSAVTCSGPRFHPALVNPNSGADLYVI